MIQVPKTAPPPPPFNDQLYRALSPIQKTLTDKTRIENVMKKYGRELPKRNFNGPPAQQWVGDNNA